MTEPKIVTGCPKLPARPTESNKGDYGRILVLAGSRNMSGAAILTGTATLRAGGGLVTIACPREVQGVIASGFPCYMTAGLPGNEHGVVAPVSETELLTMAEHSDVLAIGPGLGRDKGLTKLVGALLSKSHTPIVLDGDGLFALSELSPELLVERPHPTILTPHYGEFARLVGSTVEEVIGNRQNLAMQFAELGKCVVVLKGAGTLVTDGMRLYRNTTGNPGMATGGTGDVLTGVIAGLLGQGLAPFEAAQMGVYVHGRAGDLAAARLGQLSLTAYDLLNELPKAFQEIT